MMGLFLFFNIELSKNLLNILLLITDRIDIDYGIRYLPIFYTISLIYQNKKDWTNRD